MSTRCENIASRVGKYIHVCVKSFAHIYIDADYHDVVHLCAMQIELSQTARRDI